MIWDEFLRHFCFCDEEDSGLSDEEQERNVPKNRPKPTRKRIHQAKKNFLEKFKTASNIPLKKTWQKNPSTTILAIEKYIQTNISGKPKEEHPAKVSGCHTAARMMNKLIKDTFSEILD